MFNLKWQIALGLAVGLFGLAMLGNAADNVAGVEVLPNRTFIHKDSKTAVKIPEGWKIIAPYKLRKTSASTVLGAEKEDPLVAATIVWSPIGNQPFSNFIRASEEADLGEEYALLQTVYGKEKVGRPTTMKVGPFTVFKVQIDGGPTKDGRDAGAVYLFEAGSGDNRWRVKVRSVYPMFKWEEYSKQVEALISQFSAEE